LNPDGFVEVAHLGPRHRHRLADIRAFLLFEHLLGNRQRRSAVANACVRRGGQQARRASSAG